MPSWNIHTAHAEQLLAQESPDALGIQCVDAFLLGNLLPDIYVGYMVPDVSHKIPYKETHFADPTFVPEPRYWELIENYAGADREGHVSDLVLGAWAHLVADHDYNRHNNAFIAAHGIKPGEKTRIRKQKDFDLFGRTLDISRAPHVTPEVLRQCASFTQYELDVEDMHRTQRAMETIIANNAAHHIEGTPAYSMLDAAFFASTFDAVTDHIRSGLHAYVAGDADWGTRH